MRINKKILILGMSPGSRKKTHRNGAFNRLLRWSEVLNLPIFSFANLHPENDLPIDIRLFTEAFKYDKVIALGNYVSNTLDKSGVNHFKLPHPSFRNRKLNDPNYEREVLKACRWYLIGSDDPRPTSASGAKFAG